jgi:hypothetical protein
MLNAQVVGRQIVEESFPELRKTKIVYVNRQRIGNCFMDVERTSPGSFLLRVSKESRRLPESAFIGCVAHELSHVLIEKRIPYLFQDLFDNFYESFEDEFERFVDRIAVSRGYGSNLISLYSESYSPQSLSPEEITNLTTRKVKNMEFKCVLFGCIPK